MLLRTLSIRHCCRCFSAWVKTPKSSIENVENIFIDENVQSLLKSLNGLRLEDRIYAERPVENIQRSHYALMTDEMVQEITKKFEERAKGFLQFVPIKEPREAKFEVLAKDEEIVGFDTAKFIFTDITYDATNRDRTVVVREPDGTLRTALPEEHDRMNRVFYEQPNRPVNEPPMFSEPDLSNVLNQDRHEFLLDYACYYFEPDDQRFVEICQSVYDKTAVDEKFHLLYSTRYFGPLVFYLALNDQLAGLEKFLERVRRESDPTDGKPDDAVSQSSVSNDLKQLKQAIQQLKK